MYARNQNVTVLHHNMLLLIKKVLLIRKVMMNIKSGASPATGIQLHCSIPVLHQL